jgi:hypothetical protein
LHTPEFLNYSIKPQGSLGQQSSETVIPGGQGISATTTLMGGGVSPLTLSYSRINRKLVTFGPLDRLAGLEAKSAQNTFGANWRLRLRRLPELTVGYTKYNDEYEPLQALTTASTNRSRLLSVGLQKANENWNFESQFRADRGDQTLLNTFDPSQPAVLYKHKSQEIRGSVGHRFSESLSSNVQAGRTQGTTNFAGHPFDNTYSYVNGSTQYRRPNKFLASVRAGMTTNLIGATVQRFSDPNSSTVAAQPFILLPGEARVNLFTVAGQAQYSLTNDLRLDGDVRHEQTRTGSTFSFVNPNTTLLSGQAGIGYGRQFRRWQFQSHYAANTGTFDYALVGPSRTMGHRANASVTVASLYSIELTASGDGHVQNLRDHVEVNDTGWSGSFSASRSLFGGWTVRATYNRDSNNYEYGLVRFDGTGQGLTFTANNRYADFSVGQQIRNGLSWQFDPQLQFVSASQAALLQGTFPASLVVPSRAKYTNFIGSFHPTSRLTVRGTWVRSRQIVQRLANNDYTQWEVTGSYQFRSMNFEIGYIRHNQDYGFGLFARNRLYFRVVREFTLF